MTAVSESMSHAVPSIGPNESLQRAAQTMDRFEVGALPVCVEGRVVGIVTARDMAIRATAVGMTPNGAFVADVMSQPVHSCQCGDDAAAVARRMREAKLRRMPVVDQRQRLVGMVTLEDLSANERDRSDTHDRADSMPAQAPDRCAVLLVQSTAAAVAQRPPSSRAVC